MTVSTAGRLIVFEGIGGSGKTTALRAVADELRNRDYTVVTTRQPGGTTIGERLRQLLLDPAYAPDLNPTAQLFLYAADRYINIEHIIRPALAAGHIVLCDRYDHSTHAYQAAGGGDPAELATINHVATRGLKPHRTYWFDVPPATGRERSAAARRTEHDRFDHEALAFWQRLHDSYAAQAAADPDQIRRIDTSQPLQAVVAAVLDDLLAFVEPSR
nr:thymidylate kinase [uncultured bacterium]